jgi:TRAP-type mannitol/chloroaromatic compound transport system permease large subunit
MGMFIDPVAITMICVPVIVPTIKLLHVDLLWMTLMFTMCVILGFITPPFGLNLFYMKGVAPRGTSMMQIYQGVIPYCLLMLAVVVLCFMFPSILVWLPNAVIT